MPCSISFPTIDERGRFSRDTCKPVDSGFELLTARRRQAGFAAEAASAPKDSSTLAPSDARGGVSKSCGGFV